MERLLVTYDYDFKLFAINSTVKEYKMAWLINKAFEIDLKKKDNIELDFLGEGKIGVSNFRFSTRLCTLDLLVNKAVDFEKVTSPYLIPELPQYDYFFKFEGETDLFDGIDLLYSLKSLNEVIFAQQLDTSKITSIDNLIY